MDGEKKNNVKVLTTSEIRKHAHNWNLAGDVGLLAHLEHFSENLCQRTQETEKNFEELVESYEDVFAKVGNVTNQFLALQNCQFVENRVYDEETPTEEKTQPKPKPDAAEQEKLLLAKYKEAVETGVKLLDTHFQEVQLPPNSDSEEDDEVSTGNSFVWKPKNPYAGKKFPLLIGSNEWWADDHVGLGEYEDNVDTDKILSDSESDMDSTRDEQKDIQSSSSSIENEKYIPTKPKFLETSTEDIFGWDGNENEEYSAKDRNSVLDEPQDFYQSQENRKEDKIENFDEPFSENRAHENIVDENKDEIVDTKPSKVNNAFTRELAAKLASVTQKVDGTKNEPNKPPSKKPEEKKIGNTESLFDETDDSSDLFSTQIKNVSQSNKTLFFDSEDDNLFSGSNNLFEDGGNIFGKSDSRSVSKSNEITHKKPETAPPKKPLTNNLFEDVDDESTLFSPSIRNKPNPESSPAEDKKSSKSESVKFPKEERQSNGGGLFDSLDDDFENDFMAQSKLFDSKKKAEVPPVLKSTEIKSTEDDIFSSNDKEITKLPASKNTQTIVTEKSNTIKQPEDTSDFAQPKESKNKKTSILDVLDDEDDLFSSGLKEESLFKEEKKSSSSVKAMPLLDDDDTSLFVDKPKLQDSLSISSSRSSLFEDTISSKSRLASVFEKDKNYKMEDDIFNNSSDPLFGDDGTKKDLFSGKATSKPSEKKKTSLFDDFDDTDDLFRPSKEDSSKVDSLFKVESDMKGNKKEVKLSDEENKKQIKQTKNVFLEEPGDDDLFKVTTTEKVKITSKEDKVLENVPKIENLSVPNSDIFATPISKTTSEASFFSAIGDESFKLEGKGSVDVIKPKPPNSLSIIKDNTIATPRGVGKLNIPDNLRSKFESMAKNISSGEIRPKEEKKVVDFDEPVQSSTDVLKCPSKDRVKIQVRRRPQTRRARQEAIRKSSIDFVLEEEKPVTDALPTKVPKKEPSKVSEDPLFSSPVPSNPLSPSTDEEDYFNVPELDTNFEKEDQSIFKTDVFNTSNTSKVDDNLLFDGAPVLSPLSPKKETKKAEIKSLFSSSQDKDEDKIDSLFGSSPEEKTEEKSESKLPEKQKPGTTLFEPEETHPEVDNSDFSKPARTKEDSDLLFKPFDDHLFAPKTDSLFSSAESKHNDEDSDSDSLFGSVDSKPKPKDSVKNTEKSDGSKSSSIFNSLEKNPISSKDSQTKPKTSIFGEGDDGSDDDDDDSLFKTPKNLKRESSLFQSPKNKIQGTTKSLFDADIDDEDDLFGGKLTGSFVSDKVKTDKREETSEKSEKGEGSKKKENSGFVDPLGLMSSDD